MWIGSWLARVSFSVATAVVVLAGVASAASAVTPGWECVPTTAGQAVVSGGTGASPSCGDETTPVLAPTYVSSGVGGKPTVQFSGINVQIVSGAGATNAAVNGKGNLVLGYDESPGAQTGSHDLVLGMHQTYTSFADVVGGYGSNVSGTYSAAFGEANKAKGTASLVGGDDNTASAIGSTAIGGFDNTVTSGYGSVTGGCSNLVGTGTLSQSSNCSASKFADDFATISGGTANIARAIDASVLGGFSNAAGGASAAVSGGTDNVASGVASSVSGGNTGQAEGDSASLSGGFDNIVTSAALDASILGGQLNEVQSDFASIAGGVSNSATGEGATVVGGELNAATEHGGAVLGGCGDVTGTGPNPNQQLDCDTKAPSDNSVSGGQDNTAKGYADSILGSASVTLAGNITRSP